MSLARDITTVGSGTLASRLLAYVRDAWIAALLGAGPYSETLFAVLQVVNFFRRLLSEGALNSAFVPIWTKLRGSMNGAANAFTWRVLLMMFCVAGSIALLAAFLGSYVIAGIVPGFDDAQQSFAAFLLFMTAPYILLAGLVAVLAAEEMDLVVTEWFAQVLQETPATASHMLSTRGRLALLLADMPGKWQEQFLRPGPWPDPFVKAMRDAFLRAGPDFQLAKMTPRPLDLGPIATLTNLRLPYKTWVLIWIAAALLLLSAAVWLGGCCSLGLKSCSVTGLSYSHRSPMFSVSRELSLRSSWKYRPKKLSCNAELADRSIEPAGMPISIEARS